MQNDSLAMQSDPRPSLAASPILGICARFVVVRREESLEGMLAGRILGRSASRVEVG